MPECPACRVAYIEGESHVCTPGRGWRELRLFAGFVVQPFVAAGLGFLCFPLVERSGRALYGGTTDDATRAAVSFAAGVGIVAFFVTLCGAVPAVLWCLKRGRLTLKHVLLGAVGLGNVPFAIIVPLASATPPRGPGGSGRPAPSGRSWPDHSSVWSAAPCSGRSRFAARARVATSSPADKRMEPRRTAHS